MVGAGAKEMNLPGDSTMEEKCFSIMLAAATLLAACGRGAEEREPGR